MTRFTKATLIVAALVLAAAAWAWIVGQAYIARGEELPRRTRVPRSGYR